MKLKNYTTLFFIAICSLSLSSASAQCDDDTFKDACAEELGSYIFVKSFDISHSSTGQQSEYSYVFCNGTSYVITICDKNSGDDKMIVELYDKNKKLITTNYDKKNNKFYSKIGYPCSATGVYYMKYKSLSGKPTCGTSLIGFKKN